ncbi:MAG: hypothetical protein K0U98_01815 [Deltaproteobacteria bacterium]|nr:hypothetical protein [Deltaproteobacteria bacterium]
MELLRGIDDTSSQTVPARFSYKAEEILWYAKFESLLAAPKDNSPISVDISRLDETTETR